jgi:hypothetical protein
MAATRNSGDGMHSAPHHSDDKKDISQVERVLSAGDEKGDHVNYDRIDAEVAKYADATEVHISEEENRRLKKMIDRRVLPIMVITYFLQSLDKGTMSATSIMGIRDYDIPVLKSNATVSSNNDLGWALLTCDSLGGSLPVYTSLCSSSNTLPTGSFNGYLLPNTSEPTSWHGVLYFAATLSASAFLRSSPSEPCLVSSKLSANPLSSL